MRVSLIFTKLVEQLFNRSHSGTENKHGRQTGDAVEWQSWQTGRMDGQKSKTNDDDDDDDGGGGSV